jgi:hypothetical protein
VAGVVPAGVAALVRHFGSRPGDLRAALGPAIGPCCFEVGPEVAAAFESAMPGARAAAVVRAGPRKPHIDLRRFQRLQLEAAGLPPEHIEEAGECTFCDPAGRFFSYRRSGPATGQLVAFITLPP